MEEGEFGASVFPPKEADPSILFFHIVLCSSSLNYVRPRGGASSVGNLLCSCHHVLPQYPPGPEILPFHCPVPPVREHYVSDQVQCYGLWIVSARELV